MAKPEFEGEFPALFAIAYRVAFRTVGSGPEAEDIAQETLTRALVRWSRIHEYAAPWVATVALRLAIDVGRHDTRHPRGALRDGPTHDHDSAQRLDLQRALRRLPKRQQQVLACRYLADLPDKQTADLLGVSVGTIKQHASRGLAALRGAVSVEGTSHA